MATANSKKTIGLDVQKTTTTTTTTTLHVHQAFLYIS